MKSNSNQFALRENTASSRQRAPRLESSEGSSLSSSHNAAYATATKAARGESRLLNVREVAEMLQVPVTWVYGRTRRRSIERLPGYRLGKYWRFSETDINAWIDRRKSEERSNA
jgi:excisionase family DNA binding protein